MSVTSGWRALRSRGRGPGNGRPDGKDGERSRRRPRLDGAPGDRPAGAARAGDEPEDVVAPGHAPQPRDARRRRRPLRRPATGRNGRERRGRGRPHGRSSGDRRGRSRNFSTEQARSPVARPSSHPDRRTSRLIRCATSPTGRPASRATRSPQHCAARRRGHARFRAGDDRDPAGVRVVRVERAEEMRDAVLAALPADVAVMVAAVADWRVALAAGNKIKKRPARPLLRCSLQRIPIS